MSDITKGSGGRKTGPKKGERLGQQRSARIQYAQQRMGDLMSDVEIRDELIEKYEVSRSTAWDDIKAARDRAFTREDRKRMQAGTVMTLRRVLAESFTTERRVVCPNCKEEGAFVVAPRLDIALRTIEQVTKSFKLELSPEDLLGDEALAEQVAHYTIMHLHMWRDEDLETLGRQLEAVKRQRAGEAQSRPGTTDEG